MPEGLIKGRGWQQQVSGVPTNDDNPLHCHRQPSAVRLFRRYDSDTSGGMRRAAFVQRSASIAPMPASAWTRYHCLQTSGAALRRQRKCAVATLTARAPVAQTSAPTATARCIPARSATSALEGTSRPPTALAQVGMAGRCLTGSSSTRLLAEICVYLYFNSRPM